MNQPDYARLLRCLASMVCSCCPSRFGNPKGGTLRIPSASGFNPAVGDEGSRGRSPPSRELSGAGPSPASGSEPSPRMLCGMVRRCPRGMCRPAWSTGVSASPCLDAEGPLASKSTCGRLPTSPTTFQGVPRGPRADGHHRQRRVYTPPSRFPMAVRRGNPARRSDRLGHAPICAPRPVTGISRPESRGFPPSQYKGFPCSSSEWRWRYSNCHLRPHGSLDQWVATVHFPAIGRQPP